MSTLAVSYTFSPTTTIESGQVNQNFSDIVNFVNNTASPVGLVALWKGSIASIPTGWTIDTDLRDKFALGAGNLYAYGDVGGEVQHTLTEAEMPSHTHIQNAHKHSIQHNFDSNSNTGHVRSGSLSASGTDNGPIDNTTATNQDTGGDDPHNNMPPYYALAFIRRT